MRLKRLKICVIFLIVIGISGIQAQETIPATGGDISGSGGSVSYTVGQVVYHTYTGSNGSVAEGAQQPYEISVVTGLQEYRGINLVISVYPNPATDYLQLVVESVIIKDLSFQLYSMNGKLLQNREIIDKHTNIAMSNLVSSTYFVKVIRDKTELKTFKIIKH